MKELDGTKGYKLRNNKDMTEEAVDKHLTFTLTEDDYSEKGKEAGHLAGELKALNAEFDKIKKEWKNKIGDKEAELNVVLNTIRAQEEQRKVKCIEQKDFNEHVVRHIFNGEIMAERPMEMHERQMTLVKPAANVEKADEVSSMEQQLEELPHGERQQKQDIADVMREETGKKTAKDLSH